MKVLSILALVLFVSANSFAQTGTTGAAQPNGAAPAQATTEAPAKTTKMKKKKGHHKAASKTE